MSSHCYQCSVNYKPLSRLLVSNYFERVSTMCVIYLSTSRRYCCINRYSSQSNAVGHGSIVTVFLPVRLPMYDWTRHNSPYLIQMVPYHYFRLNYVLSPLSFIQVNYSLRQPCSFLVEFQIINLVAKQYDYFTLRLFMNSLILLRFLLFRYVILLINLANKILHMKYRQKSVISEVTIFIVFFVQFSSVSL